MMASTSVSAPPPTVSNKKKTSQVVVLKKNSISRSSKKNATISGSRGIKLRPVVVLVVVVSLLINFFRSRIKDWTITRALVGEEDEEATLVDVDGVLYERTTLANLLSSIVQHENMLPTPTPAAVTQVLPHFIKDTNLLSELHNHSLWNDCMNRKLRWMDWDAAPQNVWEHLAVSIFSRHPQISRGSGPTLAGYEYWCNIINTDKPLKWHVDKDEVTFAATENQKLVTPYMGAVWYGYPHQLEAGEGYLELLPYHPDTIPYPQMLLDLEQHVERIKPEYNRLVFLNVSQWHRVTPVTRGARYTLAVNVWTKQPEGLKGKRETTGGSEEDNKAVTS